MKKHQFWEKSYLYRCIIQKERNMFSFKPHSSSLDYRTPSNGSDIQLCANWLGEHVGVDEGSGYC